MTATGPPPFTPEQIAQLSAPLNRQHVRQRQQGGSQLSYIEAWHAIAEANRIFGFDAWQRETVELRCLSERERLVGRQQKPGWGVTWLARCRVTVGSIVREGSGAGHGIDVDLGQAHESAIKEAETDAMKRALMTFGNPFGLALYDKAQSEVTAQPSRGAAAAPRPTPAAASAARQQPPADLLARAAIAVTRSGLAEQAITLFLEDKSSGKYSTLQDLPPAWLEKLATHGIAPADVKAYNNQAEALTVPTDDEPPATWAGPTTTTTPQ